MANSLDIDLTNKIVVLSNKHYKGSEQEREFMCEGGFGCSSETSGSKIIGYFILDKEHCCISGYDIEKLAKEQR